MKVRIQGLSIASLQISNLFLQVTPTGKDDTESIQKAIDEVSASPRINGFRGAVLLQKGQYTVSSPLNIVKSGIVLRGGGNGSKDGSTITYTSKVQSNLIQIMGPSDANINGKKFRVTDDFVPTGCRTIHVAQGHNFRPGTRIMIQQTPNQAWLKDMSDMAQWGWTQEFYRELWRRTVVHVVGNEITLDAPLVQALDSVQYGGAYVFAYEYSGEIQQIGIENIRLESTYSGEEDEDHGWIAIQMMHCANCWVRHVTGQYWGYGLVSVQGRSSFVTTQDCAMMNHKSIIQGGRRYSFDLRISEFCLFHRCFSKEARHDFVSGSRTSGPNVFVDGLTINSHADIGPHERYSTGQLYDNIQAHHATAKEGQMRVHNRVNKGTGHGWTGGQVMFWNNETSIVCDAPNNAMNYAIGNIGSHIPGPFSPCEKQGIIASIDNHVTPRSLYYAQLKDRLGPNGLRHAVLPAQKKGPIFDELEKWQGEGLFLDAIVTFANEDALPLGPNQKLAIGGIVRDLNLLDARPSYKWTLLVGPGEAHFEDDQSLHTYVSMEIAGKYVLNVEAKAGKATAHATLTLQVAPMMQMATKTHRTTVPLSRLFVLVLLVVWSWYNWDQLRFL